MTLDERFEFLAKKIESLHEAVFENTRQIAKLSRKFDELSRKFDERCDRIVGLVENLVEIARNHERRITGLEDGVQ